MAWISSPDLRVHASHQRYENLGATREGVREARQPRGWARDLHRGPRGRSRRPRSPLSRPGPEGDGL